MEGRAEVIMSNEYSPCRQCCRRADDAHIPEVDDAVVDVRYRVRARG